jgi:hypothetical protein
MPLDKPPQRRTHFSVDRIVGGARTQSKTVDE